MGLVSKGHLREVTINKNGNAVSVSEFIIEANALIQHGSTRFRYRKAQAQGSFKRKRKRSQR